MITIALCVILCIVILIFIQSTKTNCAEKFDPYPKLINTEAVQTIASVYNNGNLEVNKVSVNDNMRARSIIVDDIQGLTGNFDSLTIKNLSIPINKNMLHFKTTVNIDVVRNGVLKITTKQNGVDLFFDTSEWIVIITGQRIYDMSASPATETSTVQLQASPVTLTSINPQDTNKWYIKYAIFVNNNNTYKIEFNVLAIPVTIGNNKLITSTV